MKALARKCFSRKRKKIIVQYAGVANVKTKTNIKNQEE
jgi:hypothetical protein